MRALPVKGIFLSTHLNTTRKMKTLNIILAFHCFTNFNDVKQNVETKYYFHIYAAEGKTFPHYIEHDDHIFESYSELMAYALDKSFQFFGTVKESYSTITFY
jgi:hypothetical protein